MTIGGRTISNAAWEIAAAGNQDVIRIAVVRTPREAIPLQGTWIGTVSDHLAMKVAVKISAWAVGPGRGSKCLNCDIARAREEVSAEGIGSLASFRWDQAERS
jgi:hypothetical protein